MSQLIKSTNAYRIIESEKKRNSLSHAYLITCADGDSLMEYLKELAKIISCENNGCGECRACKLIEKEAYADCTIYPTDGNKILSADVDDLISQTYIKPLENKYRVFILCGAENMNANAQNKLLKTLEEPPKNVCILIGANSDYNLLSTIKSRVKRIDIPPFSEKLLCDAYCNEFIDSQKLKRSATLCGGKESLLKKIYNGESVEQATTLCRSILSDMKSSKDIIDFSVKINKDNLSDVISAMRLEIAEQLNYLVKNDQAVLESGFTVGALLGIQDRLAEIEKSLYFNANMQMVVDSLLFGILEEKHRWQKL